jgi:hypothetical protein
MFDEDIVITSLSTSATVILLYGVGILLALYPNKPGLERGLLTQDGIKVLSFERLFRSNLTVACV